MSERFAQGLVICRPSGAGSKDGRDILGLTPQAKYLPRLRRSRTLVPDLWCGRLGRTSSMAVETAGETPALQTPPEEINGQDHFSRGAAKDD